MTTSDLRDAPFDIELQTFSIFRASVKLSLEPVCEVSKVPNDVLLYCDITKQMESYQNSALSTPGEQGEYEWCSSGHCALWKLEDLDQFCEFVLKIYLRGEHFL